MLFRSNGFKSGWSANINGTSQLSNNFAVYSSMARVVSNLYPAVDTPKMFRKLQTPINFDSDGVYYLTFKMLNRDNYGSFSSQLWIGDKLNINLTIGQTGTLIAGRLTFGGKFGTKTWNDNAENSLDYTTLYNITAKIVTKASGNDKIYVKIFKTSNDIYFPPQSWDFSLEQELNDSGDYIEYLTTLIQANMYGNIDDINIFRQDKLLLEGKSSASIGNVASVSTIQSGNIKLSKILRSDHFANYYIKPITVLYNNESTVQKVFGSTVNGVDNNDLIVESSELSVDTTATGDYKMKLFLWDKNRPMYPLAKPTILDSRGIS